CKSARRNSPVLRPRPPAGGPARGAAARRGLPGNDWDSAGRYRSVRSIRLSSLRISGGLPHGFLLTLRHGVEVEARIVDPLVEDVGEHPVEGLRDQAEVGEGEVGLVELAVLEAVVGDGADEAADLRRRRLGKRAAGGLDG